MRKPMHSRMNLAQKAAFSLAAAASASIVTGTLHAQSDETAEFSVASVRVHVNGSGYEPLSCSNGRFVSLGSPLFLLIAWAYDLNQGQMIEMQQRLPKEGGGTATLAYDVQAKAERPLAESQCKVAVQALLADRFKLAVHWESKEGQVSELVVARGGPKMQKWLDTDTGRGFTITLNGRQAGGIPGASAPTGMTMQEFAEALTNLAAIGVRGGNRQQPVIDKTGLGGRYKIDLKFSAELPGGDQVFDDPDLETALQQQLGLKLEARKGTVKIILVDHVEPPSAN
jgi:uncharacterized protein (TIGR03435 family)